MENINFRIKAIIDEFFNGNISRFCREIEVKQPTMNTILGERQSKPSYEVLLAICNADALSNVSLEWLLTGNGEMLKSDKPQKENNQSLESSEKIELLERITNLQERISNLYEVIIALTAAKNETPEEVVKKRRIYSKDIEDFVKEIEERSAKQESSSDSYSESKNAG